MTYKEFKPNQLNLILIGIAILSIAVILFLYTKTTNITSKYFTIIFIVWFCLILILFLLKYFGCVACRSIIRVYKNKFTLTCPEDPSSITAVNKVEIKKIIRFKFKNNWTIGILLKNPKNFINKDVERQQRIPKWRKVCLYILSYSTFKHLFSLEKYLSRKTSDIKEVGNIMIKFNENKLNCHFVIFESYYTKNFWPGFLSISKLKNDTLYKAISKFN